jgi:predicted transcriptional regulator
MDNLQPIITKKSTCSDLLTCLYNLKSTDSEIFFAVAKNPEATLDDIASEVKRDRSSVHRCLAKLVTAGLVAKESKSIKGGGYYHIYTMVELEKIKKHAKERTKEITESLNELISNFDSDLKRYLEP